MSEPKTVTLDGRSWNIPELSVRQIIKIVPSINIIRRLAGGNITEAELSALYGVAFIALTKGYPELTREQFDDMHITIQEIAAAMPTIADQAGLEWKKRPEGEASGEAPATSQTGTP